MKKTQPNLRLWPRKDRFEIMFPLGVALLTSVLYTITSDTVTWSNFLFQIVIMVPVILAVHLKQFQLLILYNDRLIIKSVFMRRLIYFEDVNTVIIKEYVSENQTEYSLKFYTDSVITINHLETFKQKEIEDLLKVCCPNHKTHEELNRINWMSQTLKDS